MHVPRTCFARVAPWHVGPVRVHRSGPRWAAGATASIGGSHDEGDRVRAAVYRTLGPASDVLEIVEVDDPVPGPGEVRVRLTVSGVNPTDWKRRSGPAGAPADWPEKIPNQDGAGVVDAVGEGVDASRVGQRVWVWFAAQDHAGGSAAHYVCLPQRRAVPLPDGASFDLGAGLGIPFMTAHAALFAFSDRQLGGRQVLVTGGAGAVGNAAIQLAALAGAEVIATVSSADKAALAREAGAAHTIDYRREDVTARLRELAPAGIGLVVDVAVQDNVGSYVGALAPEALIVGYAADAARDSCLPVRDLMALNARTQYLLVYTLPDDALDGAVAGITAALEAGALRSLPVHRFTLEEIAAAHDAVEAGAVGKVLVDLP